MPITTDQAITEANKQMLLMGYKIDDMEVIHDQNSEVLKIALTLVRNNNNLLWEKIENKKYLAIYYKLKSKKDIISIGPEILIFLDREEGSVIAVQRFH